MIPKLSHLYTHDDDIILAIERWVRNEAHVGLMGADDARRIQKAGEELQRRKDAAWCPSLNWKQVPFKEGEPIPEWAKERVVKS